MINAAELHLYDPVLLREGDGIYGDEIVAYLRERGLKVHVGGSVLNGKDYRDVDILATGPIEPIKAAALDFFLHDAGTSRFPLHAQDGEKYSMQSVVAEYRMTLPYLDRVIDFRYEISIASSLFDVCLLSIR